MQRVNHAETDTLRPLSFHSARYALWKEAPLAGTSVKLWAVRDKEDLHELWIPRCETCISVLTIMEM